MLVCNFTKRKTPSGCFSRFLNCTDNAKSRKGSQITERVSGKKHRTRNNNKKKIPYLERVNKKNADRS